MPIFHHLDASLPNSGAGKILIDILSTVIVLLMIISLGVVSKFFFARWIINASEMAINKIPGVGMVYRTVKQIVDTFSKQNKAVFQAVVMLEFPRTGLYAVGFVTSKAKGEIQERTGEVVVNVFVPTTPNPTSGFLIFVPKKDVIELDMSVEEGLKFVVSCGIVEPEKLAAKVKSKSKKKLFKKS